ncbi:MAG TPA: LysR family transcriptional regulator [Candidatus Avidesulfovibrio excrementigallinarum]|nr:LysR family transcriptional regulator [Candidatus Avidesulfovibrio excrementigallinarum]
MEFRLLRSFLAVAREQSISGAARTLHITQPSLSRQIMDLEDEMGVTLFERGNRKITLTRQGQFLHKRAGQILELVQKTREEMAVAEEEVSGSVRIGAGETRAFRVLAASVHALIAQYPAVRFHLFSGNAEDVAERLDKGLLDFGLFIEPYDVTKYHYLRLPLNDLWGVLMRKDSPLAERDAIRAEDLWNVPLICSRQALAGGQLTSWLNRDPEKLNIAGTYNLLFNASIMVEMGAGYALCLEGIVNTAEDTPLCFRPLTPPLHSYVDVVWKKNQLFSKPSELLLAGLREQCSGSQSVEPVL